MFSMEVAQRKCIITFAPPSQPLSLSILLPDSLFVPAAQGYYVKLHQFKIDAKRNLLLVISIIFGLPHGLPGPLPRHDVYQAREPQ
jgi:hypothetical protein